MNQKYKIRRFAAASIIITTTTIAFGFHRGPFGRFHRKARAPSTYLGYSCTTGHPLRMPARRPIAPRQDGRVFADSYRSRRNASERTWRSIYHRRRRHVSRVRDRRMDAGRRHRLTVQVSSPAAVQDPGLPEMPGGTKRSSRDGQKERPIELLEPHLPTGAPDSMRPAPVQWSGPPTG